jgi:hypothetical protein
MPLITLTTDFGLTDAYVGTMKGVIARLCPSARVIDITHGIARGDLPAAALALATAAPFFPRGTIHVAVVDPGVGSRRAALVIRTREATFVGPDNGILWPATHRGRVLECRRIENRDLCLPEVSATFHGRDVFAPVAAYLAKGRPLDRVGTPHRRPVRLAWPEPVREDETLRGEVLTVDHFGNAITNLPAAWLARPKSRHLTARIGAGKTRGLALVQYYAAVPIGHPLAVLGSSGFLEISVNQGSAAEQLRLKVGSPVTVRWQRS